MTASTRTPGSVIWSLFLALLNATLILVALCLWLGWHVLSEARAITIEVAERMAVLTPVTDEIAGLRAEVAGLRGDLAGLQGQAAGSDVGSGAMAAVGDRLSAIETRIATTGERIDAVIADPGALVDRAVDRAALQIKSGIADCTPSGV